MTDSTRPSQQAQEWRCDECGAVVTLPATLTDEQAEAVLRSHQRNCGSHCGPECDSAGQEHPRLPGGIYLTESREGYKVLITDGFGWWKDCTDDVIGHDLVRYWQVGDLVHTTDAKDSRPVTRPWLIRVLDFLQTCGMSELRRPVDKGSERSGA